MAYPSFITNNSGFPLCKAYVAFLVCSNFLRDCSRWVCLFQYSGLYFLKVGSSVPWIPKGLEVKVSV